MKADETSEQLLAQQAPASTSTASSTWHRRCPQPPLVAGECSRASPMAPDHQEGGEEEEGGGGGGGGGIASTLTPRWNRCRRWRQAWNFEMLRWPRCSMTSTAQPAAFATAAQRSCRVLSPRSHGRNVGRPRLCLGQHHRAMLPPATLSGSSSFVLASAQLDVGRFTASWPQRTLAVRRGRRKSDLPPGRFQHADFHVMERRPHRTWPGSASS